MIYTTSRIENEFGHKLIVNTKVKKIICETILNLPEKLIRTITKTCWIVSSFEDGWAFVVRASDLKKGESIIFLSDELLKENVDQIKETLVHEIGHVILGHRNSIGKVQSKSEVKRQEIEADEFVVKYLS